MTELDAELGPEAVELIAEFGATVQLHRVTTGSYDPATQKPAYSEAAGVDLKAAVEDERGLVVMPDGSSVKGDQKLTVAALGFDKPSIGDKVTVLGIKYSINQMKTIMSGELPCLYILWAWKN